VRAELEHFMNQLTCDLQIAWEPDGTQKTFLNPAFFKNPGIYKNRFHSATVKYYFLHTPSQKH